MGHRQVYIGTSGWNYRHWRGIFYSRKLRQADWLSYFAQYFSTSEINNSFYRIPRKDVIQQWAGQVPRRFRFAVKLWRGITQYKKLKDSGHYLQIFFRMIDVLPKRQRGPVLVQLPPQQGCDLGKLDAFLTEVRQITAPARWKIAVEFRNNNWLRDDVYRLLDRQRAALCLHDMWGRGAVDEPNDASFIYVRRHGSPAFEGRYTDEEIEADLDRIRKWREAGKTVWIYYNNDLGGHAVTNAMQLQARLAAITQTDERTLARH